MRPQWLAAAAAALALPGLACGSARPTARSAPSRLDAGIHPGTVLSLITADTGQPAAEATVKLAGQTYASDTTGHVVLAQGATSGSPLDILASGMLDRQTLLRSPSDTAFSLWPRSSPTGLDESYTRQLVYSWASDDNPGTSPLYRLSGVQAVLVPSAALQADGRSMAAHQRAAAEVNAAVGGAVYYAVAAEAPAGAVAFTTVLDPEDEGCEDRVLAFTSIRLKGGEISSGTIVFCTAAASRDGTVVHEVGHTFGLGHSPDAREVMHAFKLGSQPDAYSGRESLAMRLMLQRRGGNRFPDNDRAVSAAASGEVEIVCH